MRTITITFDGEPYLPELVQKIADQRLTIEALKPGTSFMVYLPETVAVVSMLGAPAAPSFVDGIRGVPCSQAHAEAMSDGVPIDCPRCG